MDDGLAALRAAIGAKKFSGRMIEMEMIGGTVDQLIGATVCIEYSDSAGSQTRRWVTIESVDAGPPATIFVYCWKRREMRTFRADRISSVNDHDGECIGGDEFFASYGVPVPPNTVQGGAAVTGGRFAAIRGKAKTGRRRKNSATEIGGSRQYGSGFSAMAAAERQINALQQAVPPDQPRRVPRWMIAGWMVVVAMLALLVFGPR